MQIELDSIACDNLHSAIRQKLSLFSQSSVHNLGVIFDQFMNLDSL